MRRLRAVGVLVGLLVGPACSLLLDSEGLSGTPPIDGSAPAQEGSAADGGNAVDAEAGPTATSPCASGTTHFLCADFDSLDFASGWTTEEVSTGATLVPNDDHVSPPKSLRPTIPPSSTDVGARLNRTLPTTQKRAHLSMRL